MRVTQPFGFAQGREHVERQMGVFRQPLGQSLDSFVKAMGTKQIIHLDMDAFYPAVEVLDNPELKGKAVIVGGSRTRGVVSSASYEARKFGVHSAQPMATAVRLCPAGIVLPVRMSRYKEVSRQVFSVFHRFTPLVEPLSIDEAFLDVTGSTSLFGDPVAIAKRIKRMVLEETGLTVSAGLAPSKFVAKIASDLENPDGLTIVRPGHVREVLDPLPISKMWGAGKKTQQALERLGIRTFRDLRRAPFNVLEKAFGKWGVRMHELAEGIDDRDVIPFHEAKSIGHEETLAENIVEIAAAKKELLRLADRVARRMRSHGITGKTVTLKVKYADFVQITRAAALPQATDDGGEIYAAVCPLLAKTAVGNRPVRLLGISVSQLTHPTSQAQLSIFQHDRVARKRKDLNRALDSLYERFGNDSVRPGTLFSE
jgi:DNA polymerase-4